jgi:hypothetical protein
MLIRANLCRSHSETVLAFGGAKKENRLLAEAFGVDKAGVHPV